MQAAALATKQAARDLAPEPDRDELAAFDGA